MERDEILAQIRKYMVALFDVSPEAIVLDADLAQDLDLDSIDAVDLVVELQKLTGRKIKPEEFKTVRSVGDIVERVYELTHAQKT